MKTSMLVLAASVVLASATPALAHTETFTAALSGPAEFPVNASPGTGFATVIINDHDFSMDVTVSFSGLVGTVTASHIHCCTATAGQLTAGVATITPTFTDFPLGVRAESYHHLYDMSATTGSWNPAFVTANGGTPGAAFNTLLAGLESGKAYLNIHSTSVPSGEIRGFLQLQPVPEPATYGLMLGGLALLGLATRRRQRT